MRELLRQSEGEDVVALFGAEFAVAAGGDDEILFAAQSVGHGSGLASGGEFETPEFRAGVRIEGVNLVVHGGGRKNEAASGGDGAAERDRSCFLAGNE